jgi:hypothetical protein
MTLNSSKTHTPVPYSNYDPTSGVALALEEARAKGWMRIVRRTKKDGPVYELTAAGRRFVEGLPRVV